MSKKTWKIGEYCKGGVITSEVKGNTILVIGKDWDFSTGSNKKSNQSNAKEFIRLSVDVKDINNGHLDTFLNELTSYYYAEQVMNWIKTKLLRR